MKTNNIIKVAAAHIAPVFLNKIKTTEKAIAIIQEASRNGAKLIVFPESYIPAFPVWASFRAPIDNHSLFQNMVQESIYADGAEIEMIKHAATQCGVFVSMGFSERSRHSVACLWNSNVLISDEGVVLNHHRKLVPTFFEKMIWASGDGAGLKVAETRIGNIGALICGENTNPLARYSLIAQSEQIHISTWPALWPTRRPGDGVNFDNVAANRLRASAHSFEAKAFSVICAGYMDDYMVDFLGAVDPQARDILQRSPRGATMFVNPRGEAIGDCLSDEEGIAYAVFDLDACIEPKQFHDVSGYYNRFDVFSMRVNRERLEPVAWDDPVPPPVQSAEMLPEKKSSQEIP
ncbi:aliphatic nitrilase|uniref:Aliphatic nitrilase n=1 Tax=Brenneria salicis ATCC 15712 = DSM 30166 TaxID=714314 RepID=A0A366IA84_9GAMM|nr:carbon-nitrogen hydrolase family protein [Brenneria salicis]NMN90641.1 aliphatic nitrilase [Brenneria salicis ATCC 15712 = DSM 30166]RBP66863.1 aliphatic nitrilase [Brenneria salicis ATCC 15712 = DSM 30166]RLM32155.1 aliphatic nitrilase [Brenneria salicis ATCC 15712 = DSM 30166]